MKRTLDNEYDNEYDISRSVDLEQVPKDFRDRHTRKFGEAINHILKVDPTLLHIIVKQDFPLFLEKEQEPQTVAHHYAKLASAILSQQISGAAARSIKARLMKNYNDEFPTHLQLHEDFQQPSVEKEYDLVALVQGK